MFRIIISLLGLVSVPILVCLAWRGWARNLRRELPPWRSAVSFSALLLLSLTWMAVALLEGTVFLRPEVPRPEAFLHAMLTLLHPLAVVLIVLAFGLRGVPRIQAVLAGFLLFLSWPLGYV